MYLVMALHKFVNEEQTRMRWKWKKCIMDSLIEMNDVGVEVYTNWAGDLYSDGMHAKQLMPPFSWEHPDAMDAFKRY
jgi:hypothetical protein